MQNNKLDLPPNIPSISYWTIWIYGLRDDSIFENIKLEKDNYLNIPDSIFIRPSITLVFDNVK